MGKVIPAIDCDLATPIIIHFLPRGRKSIKICGQRLKKISNNLPIFHFEVHCRSIGQSQRGLAAFAQRVNGGHQGRLAKMQ